MGNSATNPSSFNPPYLPIPRSNSRDRLIPTSFPRRVTFPSQRVLLPSKIRLRRRTSNSIPVNTKTAMTSAAAAFSDEQYYVANTAAASNPVPPPPPFPPMSSPPQPPSLTNTTSPTLPQLQSTNPSLPASATSSSVDVAAAAT